MFCPNCGTQLPDNSKFCFDCGFKLVKPSQSDAENEEQILGSLRDTDNDIIEDNEGASNSPSETNNRNNKRDILWEIISALIILAGFCLVRLLR